MQCTIAPTHHMSLVHRVHAQTTRCFATFQTEEPSLHQMCNAVPSWPCARLANRAARTLALAWQTWIPLGVARSIDARVRQWTLLGLAQGCFDFSPSSVLSRVSPSPPSDFGHQRALQVMTTISLFGAAIVLAVTTPVNGQADNCNVCGTTATNVNDYTSRAAMEARDGCLVGMTTSTSFLCPTPRSALV